MNEKIFQNDFLLSCKQAGLYLKKIPDAIRSSEARFIPQKPFDVFGLYLGKFYAMELKYLKVKRMKTKYSSFSLSKIRDNQLAELREVTEHGGRGFIILAADVSAVMELPYDSVAFLISILAIPDNKGVMEFEDLLRFDYLKKRQTKAGEELKHRWDVAGLFFKLEASMFKL